MPDTIGNGLLGSYKMTFGRLGLDFDQVSKEFFEMIDPERSTTKEEELATELNVGKGYRTRTHTDTRRYPLTLVKTPIPADYKPLDYSTELELCNTLDYSKIPTLAHGLDRTLSEPGVHPVGDFDGRPNFSRYLSKIHDFDSLIIHSSYKPPSQDTTLISNTLDHGCSYLSSTSSITTVLTKLYLTIFKKDNIDASGIGSSVARMDTFTPQVGRPNSIFLNSLSDTIWGIDANGGTMEQNNKILSDLGHSMERMVTLSEEEFTSKLVKENASVAHEFDESYVFSKFGKIMYRSQIDCYSDKLPGKSKVFDLKTRATASIRLNVADYESYLSYHLTQVLGFKNSYEKEFHDMVRSSGIKYTLQAKIGHMAGIFVAYHNTKRIFGAEFLPLEELEDVIFWGKHIAEDSFRITNSMLSIVLDTITAQLDRKFKYRLFFEVNKNRNAGDLGVLQIFVEELSVAPEFKHNLFTYTSLTDLQQQESEQIVNPVTMYSLDVQTTVNGFKTLGPLHYNPEDQLQVFYSLKKSKLPQEKIRYEYARIIRDSRLYQQFSG
eukprot:gene7199-8362_t